jgi:hypothetical protein
MERTPGAAEDRRFGAGARGRMQGRRLRRIRQKSVGPRCARRDSIAGNDFGSLVTCPSLAVASCFCDFLASAAFLLKNRRDAIFCKVSRNKATHLEKEPEQNV